MKTTFDEPPPMWCTCTTVTCCIGWCIKTMSDGTPSIWCTCTMVTLQWMVHENHVSSAIVNVVHENQHRRGAQKPCPVGHHRCGVCAPQSLCIGQCLKTMSGGPSPMWCICTTVTFVWDGASKPYTSTHCQHGA